MSNGRGDQGGAACGVLGVYALTGFLLTRLFQAPSLSAVWDLGPDTSYVPGRRGAVAGAITQPHTPPPSDGALNRCFLATPREHRF